MFIWFFLRFQFKKDIGNFLLQLYGKLFLDFLVISNKIPHDLVVEDSGGNGEEKVLTGFDESKGISSLL